MKVLKYVTGYNHYSQRHHVANNKITSERYLRYNQKEDQQYAVECEALIEINKNFIEKLERELRKISKMIEEEEVLECIISDIWKYLLDNNRDYIVNQEILDGNMHFEDIQ